MNLTDRLFRCTMATGFSYADQTREVRGDYKRLAFLPFSTCELEIEPDCPPELREMIEEDALNYWVGKVVQTSSSGQTITMGYERIAAGEPVLFFGPPCDRWDEVEAAQDSPFLYIVGNGSPFNRDQRLHTLFTALEKYRLDVERFGEFWTVGRQFRVDGVLHFFGGFEDFAHGFIILTNHVETIARLQDAIRANLARQGREV